MSKYKLFVGIVSYFIFVTLVVNSIGIESDNILPPEQLEVQTGVIAALNAMGEFFGTFWKIMSFQLPQLPYWVTLTFYVCSLGMFLIIASLIRGTD